MSCGTTHGNALFLELSDWQIVFVTLVRIDESVSYLFAPFADNKNDLSTLSSRYKILYALRGIIYPCIINLLYTVLNNINFL